MYNWRKLTPTQKTDAVRQRQQQGVPWHSPPHQVRVSDLYHVTAANYEHQPVIGANPERMAAFERDLVRTMEAHTVQTLAWCVLPNHYHALVQTSDIRCVTRVLGKLHGRTSHCWNGEDNSRGRQCWCRCSDRSIRSERHRWATLNYIHHNPVHHGYVLRWQDWPYSSAIRFIEEVGREKAERIWRAYPLLDYGKDWDAPTL